MKSYEIRTGHSVQRWDSPYDYSVPQPENPGLGGAYSSIEEALDHPIGSAGLEELARSAKKIVIVVPDITRGWSRAPEMNAAVRRRISAATKCPVTWIAATGQHRAATEKEMPLVYGSAPVWGDTLLSHNCDDTVNTGLKTSTGTPVWLNAAFAGADLAVLVGGITYHDMAGFSGGRKMIMPGISGRRSIVVNHNHCLINGQLNPATDSGLLENNPMAQDQKEYAGLALRGKKCFIINTIADGLGKPAAWVAGDLWKAWETGCETCRSLDSLYILEKAARCVASCGGYPFDIDLYQATKALFSPLSALRTGAPVVLAAGVEDSLGPGSFAADLPAAMHDPAAFARRMETAFTIPGYIALRTVLESQRHPMALVTERENVPFPGRVFRTMQEADRWLQEVSGTDGLSLLVKSGNAIHVFVKASAR
ncbi:MAG: lactate racemase domain-containing protein [Pyramidobacter sp.]